MDELILAEILKNTNTNTHQHDGLDSLQIPFETLQGVSQCLIVRTMSVTPTQVLALFSTPITIVPASGPNSFIIVDGITAQLKYNTATYAGTNNLEFRYTNAAGTKVTADMAAAFLNSASTAYNHVAGIVTAFTPIVNAPIVVSVPVANPTTGNSVLNITVKYRILSF